METKICTKCKIEFPMTDEYYYRSYGKFKPSCKVCCGRKSFLIKTVSEKDGMKICSNCNTEKTIDSFYPSTVSKDKLHVWCKTCASFNAKDNYIKNIVTVTKQHKLYDELNKEAISTRRKLFYINNIDTITQRSKIYRESHKEIVSARDREYYISHKEQSRIRYQRYRATKRNLPHTLTVNQWNMVKSHFDNRCAYCGKKLPLAQDHFVALSKKGEYSHNNIIPSCKHCNSSKSDKSFFKWFPKYEYYSIEREKRILKFLHYKNKVQQLTLAI